MVEYKINSIYYLTFYQKKKYVHLEFYFWLQEYSQQNLKKFRKINLQLLKLLLYSEFQFHQKVAK